MFYFTFYPQTCRLSDIAWLRKGTEWVKWEFSASYQKPSILPQLPAPGLEWPAQRENSIHTALNGAPSFHIFEHHMIHSFPFSMIFFFYLFLETSSCFWYTHVCMAIMLTHLWLLSADNAIVCPKDPWDTSCPVSWVQDPVQQNHILLPCPAWVPTPSHASGARCSLKSKQCHEPLTSPPLVLWVI